jgi:HD-GYP domain-containing protein (c-di-GMP phosphodiesterase class II)
MPQITFEHEDVLNQLNKDLPLSSKLTAIHAVLKNQFKFINRIAVAIYDPKTDFLKTFIHSSGGPTPLSHYQAKLSDATSLQDIINTAKPRVVNDLDVFSTSKQEHSQKVLAGRYSASYTMPMYINGTFFGFIFFNSYEKDVFEPEILHQLDLFGHLVSLMITNELASIKTLLATVKTARDMTHERDPETGAHLDRMSHFARLIAKELADKYQLDDEYIEHIFLFSPLHDIGKIGVPDEILLKNGKLDPQEYEIMKTHSIRGREIIDQMLENFGLNEFQHIDILRNIAEFHHEALNGEGYPSGLKGTEIPIEARIVSVADVFDALTSRRPYKEAWTNEESFSMLRRMAGLKLDPDCVEALIKHRNEVERIQSQFQEDLYG